MNIDNVKLSPMWNHNVNLIKNGDFEDPQLEIPWKHFDHQIPSWTAEKIEIGRCKDIYNKNWPAETGQCAELDSDKNQRYTQKV